MLKDKWKMDVCIQQMLQKYHHNNIKFKYNTDININSGKVEYRLLLKLIYICKVMSLNFLLLTLYLTWQKIQFVE